MRPSRPVLALVGVLLLTGCSGAPPPAPATFEPTPSVPSASPPVTPVSPSIETDVVTSRPECPWWDRVGYGPEVARLPLARAVFAGDPARVRRLLDRGADPDVIDPRQWGTPLALAALGGCTRMVRILLDAGADPALVRERGLLPLASAVERGDRRSVVRLLRAGADPSQAVPVGIPIASGLHQAVSRGDQAVLALLIPRASDLDVGRRDVDPLDNHAYSASPLESAARLGDVPTMARLVRSGAKPTDYAVQLAIAEGHEHAVRWFLERGQPAGPRAPWVRLARLLERPGMARLLAAE